ncbi:MAG: HEXXH motif-containing putative peptide modification protein [Cyanobacteriota bacterium]|nr:HEXXH motif-containing putative peptide modification protein [Cyanobacteriota bacterium]
MIKDLLDFRLPPFVRLNWVNNRAETQWLEPMQNAAQLWLQLEIRSVSAGLRAVTLQEQADLNELALPAELTVSPLPTLDTEILGPPIADPIVIGQASAVKEFTTLWENANSVEMGLMLGYPTCCIQHFQDVYRDSRLWYAPWAWLQTERERILNYAVETNILLSILGLKLLPHIPCCPNCSASVELAQAYLGLVQSEQEQVSLEYLQEILAWPTLWSALHGIAEIKTPIFRIAMDVAATGQRYQIQKQGQAWPLTGASGIRFPYQLKKSSQAQDTDHCLEALQNPVQVFTATETDPQVEAWSQHIPETDPKHEALNLPKIDWRRVAIPQADGYDTEMILACAAQRYPSFGREEHLILTSTQQTTFLDGAVAIAHLLPYCPLGLEFEPGPLQHPNFQIAENLLRCWPVGYAQVQALVHTFVPAVHRNFSEQQWSDNIGSCSHCFEHEFGIIYATIHDPVALAQALVYEMAHLKLFALGLGQENKSQLIANSLPEHKQSTIKIDEPCPISAILYTQYASIHVLELNIHIILQETHRHQRSQILHLLDRNVHRMQAGHKILVDSVESNQQDTDFVISFLNWSEKIINQGIMLLEAIAI